MPRPRQAAAASSFAWWSAAGRASKAFSSKAEAIGSAWAAVAGIMLSSGRVLPFFQEGGWSRPVGAQAAGTSANEYIAAENAIDSSSDPILLGISFFSISYKPQYYYWESIDLFRKLFVTSIVVYGSSCFCNSRSRALWWVLLSTILKNSIVPFHHAYAQVMC